MTGNIESTDRGLMPSSTNFNTDNTKVVVTGSKLDKPCTFDANKVRVVDSNKHLGLVVSAWRKSRRM